MRRRVARWVRAHIAPEAYAIDDSGFPKDGYGSPGVARMHCGALGERGTCQTGVSVNLVPGRASAAVDWRLFIHRRCRSGRAGRVAVHVREAITRQSSRVGLPGHRHGRLRHRDLLLLHGFDTPELFRRSLPHALATAGSPDREPAFDRHRSRSKRQQLLTTHPDPTLPQSTTAGHGVGSADRPGARVPRCTGLGHAAGACRRPEEAATASTWRQRKHQLGKLRGSEARCGADLGEWSTGSHGGR